MDGFIFKMGDSAVVVDTDVYITIRAKDFRVSKGLWETFTLEKVNRLHVTSDELTTNKKSLLTTNVHLAGY